MPELPEIMLTVSQLNKILKNADILKITGYGRYKNYDFNINLPVKINSINNKGKFIYWILNDGQYIFNTLGLSGHWSIQKQPNISIELHYKKNNNLGKLYLIDQLHYATFSVHDNLNEKLNSIGPDMVDTHFQIFKSQLIKQSNKPIGSVLMDQSIVSGIGNYIRAEALYKSKISPFRKVKDIPESALTKLYKSIRSIIRESYKSGGASITFYKNINGDPGNYEDKLDVYGHELDTFGNKVSHDKLDDRTIYWVPAIQK